MPNLGLFKKSKLLAVMPRHTNFEQKKKKKKKKKKKIYIYIYIYIYKSVFVDLTPLLVQALFRSSIFSLFFWNPFLFTH